MASNDAALRDVTGGPIAWRESGSPDAPVAVFLHGLAGNRSSWDPQLTGLATLRRCAAWELPGYGDSPGLPGSLTELADVAAEWIATLVAGTATGSVDVVGLSFGGMVAQHLALNHPDLVRTLALLDTSPRFGMDGVTTREDWLATRVEPLRDPQSPSGTAERAAQLDQVVAGLVGAACPAPVRDLVVASMSAVPGASLAASCRALVDHDTRDRLAEIQAPTLVLVGAEDTETPPDYSAAIAERIPGARMVVLPGTGHLSNLESPEAVDAELRHHWLTSQERS